jgi:TPR repeat protein
MAVSVLIGALAHPAPAQIQPGQIRWEKLLPSDDDLRARAEKGDAEAQYKLGLRYAKGEGVAQDHDDAVRWYRRAAEQGDVKAQFNLGVCYAKGEGVPQDRVQAYAWFNLAAAQGHKDAASKRDLTASLMTREELAEGQRLARQLHERIEGAKQARAAGEAR